jgi:hypothetical protein
VRVDLGWASVQWYFGVTHVQFQIGREFTIIETNCPTYASHVSLPWHVGLQWDWLGIPTWGEGSCVADTCEFPINIDVDYYFIAKRVNYQSTECWTELNVFIFNGGPEKDGDEDFQSLSLPPPTGGGGGGGGGCVLQNTRILMANGGTIPICKIRPGDKIAGYDVDAGTFVTETVISNNCTIVDEILSINKGLLFVTPTDQPIFTDYGWIKDPKDLKIGWQIYDPTAYEWIRIDSLATLKGHFRVYELVATNPNTFIGNGILLDMKAMLV